MRFLADEGVQLEAVDAAVRGDPSGNVLVLLMDRFGLWLSTYKTAAGNALARHSVMQYFRQAKMWLLERFPRHAPLVEKALLKKGRVLEGFCVKRPTGKMVKQASACTKSDLRLLLRYLYTTATVATDYQDIGLLALLWYLFGRASDLTLLQKCNLSLCSENVFFVRFVRVKTSEEQGVTLFPASCPLTCPITAIAVALALQSTPSLALLPHLPVPTENELEVRPLSSLAAVLAGGTGGTGTMSLMEAAEEDADAGGSRALATPGIHAYVNRVLNRIAAKAGVTSVLSSHSFRRGGAQHANGSSALSLQWITDRGGWNLTTLNKGLSYIFNTTKEDQKVAKILSNHPVDTEIRLHSLSMLGSVTRPKAERVASYLFASCYGLNDSQKNISSSVMNVLAAYLIKSFPQLKSLAPQAPLVCRVDEALKTTGVTYEEFIAWAAHLSTTPTASTQEEIKPEGRQAELLQSQAALIDDLINLNKKLAERVRKIEEMHDPRGASSMSPPVRETPTQNGEGGSDVPAPKRRKSGSTNLVDSWYAWFTMTPAAKSSMDAKTKSSMRQLVSYMRLFSTGYTLDPSQEAYRDTVLEVAASTAANVHAFLDAHHIKARSTGTVLKAMRGLHQGGELNQHITEYESRLALGLIVDPSPPATLRALEPVPPALPN